MGEMCKAINKSSERLLKEGKVTIKCACACTRFVPRNFGSCTFPDPATPATAAPPSRRPSASPATAAPPPLRRSSSPRSEPCNL